MATWRAMPDVPGAAPTAQLEFGLIFEWIQELLHMVAEIILPIKDIDAKLATLVGDDTKRIVGEHALPSWITGVLTLPLTYEHHMIDYGCLGTREWDYEHDQPEYVPFFKLMRTMMFNLIQALSYDTDLRTPFFRRELVGRGQDNLYDDAWSNWRVPVPPNELVAPWFPPDVVHLLGSIAGMMTLADSYPLPTFKISYVAKEGVGEDASWHGSLTEIEAAKELQIVSRIQQYQLTTQSAGGG